MQHTDTNTTIETFLTDADKRLPFLTTCAEFLDYVESDCAGLSPGINFFRQSYAGLRHLAKVMPEHAELLEAAATTYLTLVAEVGASPMYPRCSEILTLATVATINERLCTLVETEEAKD